MVWKYQFWQLRINSPFLQEEQSNGPLGNHRPWLNLKFYSQGPQKWIDTKKGSQSHSGPFSDGHVGRSAWSRPVLLLGYLWNHRERNSLGVSPNQINRNLQACGYGCPYMGKPSWNMPSKGKQRKDRAREGGQGFLHYLKLDPTRPEITPTHAFFQL